VNGMRNVEATAGIGLVRRLFRSGLPCLLVAAIVAFPAAAGQFSVSPVRLYMVPKDRAIAVTISNEGDEPLIMQADLYLWKQKPDGEDDLTLTEDLFLSPPIIKLAPKARQVVRLAMVRPSQPSQQLTYRMIVREIPEARTDATLQVQVAMAFSLPVFITPPSAKYKLGCAAERAADAIRAICENTGTAYARPTEFVLSNPAGAELASSDSGGYILPAVKRGFDLKRVLGGIPGGNAKLTVRLDDGSAQTFDVKLAD
jgi:fimbrial chaperone protein